MTETDYCEIYQLIERLHNMADRPHAPSPEMMHMVANTMEFLLKEIQELKQLMNEE